ncbi:MAG: replication endonuclease [Candidatus Oceanisphaera merdipullorum]|nr:replication endonuclease [Candidatus Oceanisphaera merdipullorum]
MSLCLTYPEFDQDVAQLFAAPEKEASRKVAGTDVIESLFTEHHLRENLRWAGQLLSEVDDHAGSALFAHYQNRLKKGHKPKGVNAWLRTSVASIKEHAARFPLPLRMVSSELGRANIAREWSNRCTSIILQHSADFTRQVNAEVVLKAAMVPANQWGISPLLPQFDGPQTDRQLEMAASALMRLQDYEWWQRQVTRAWRQYAEHVAILVGRVRRGVSAYVSNHALKDHQQRKRAGMAWLKTMYAINPELELEIPLAEAVKASVANPEIRRMELMVRMRGFEDLAEEEGLVGEFYTWTAPSKYHAWSVVDNKRKAKNGEKLENWVKTIQNKKYQGFTPKQTQKYLCKQWEKARAKLDRLGIRRFGFRVVEPHHDGTPHWHMLVFVQPNQRRLLRSVLRQYAIQHDREELGRKGYRARFDWKEIKEELGSATGYIAKYISKNIDGFNMDWDDEAQEAVNTSAQAVGAWASLWNVRQFQQIGGPSVEVWRQLRRIREASRNPIIEPARRAADTGKWADFITAMGGIEAARKDHLIKLAHIIKPAANKYGEDVAKLTGLRTTDINISVNGVVSGVMLGLANIQTKVDGWELSCTGLSERSEMSFSERSDQPLSGGSQRPWSSDNNCTQGSVLSEKDRIAREMAMLGLDGVDRQRLEAGATVTIDGLYVRIRNGQLLTTTENPRFTNNGADDFGFVPQPSKQKQWYHRILGDLLSGSVPVEDFITSVPDAELGAVIHQIDSALQQERFENPQAYKENPLWVMLEQLVTDTIDDHEFRSEYLD